MPKFGEVNAELEQRRLAKIAEKKGKGIPWSEPDATPLQDMEDVVSGATNPEPEKEPIVRIWPQTPMICHSEYLRQWLLSVLAPPTSPES